MPTISVHRTDLESLIETSMERGGTAHKPVTHQREQISTERLEELLQLVKGEYKGQDSDTGEWRVELQDSNRPDLWCCEGIARQIRIKRGGKPLSYPFFSKKAKTTQRILVGPGIEKVRPYVAACSAIGYEVTEAGLAQLIQTQEKLADMFARKRRTVSIGIYRLAKIRFPVHYELVKPDEARFTPLGLDQPMTLGEMLMVHPKGVEYGGILAGAERLPLLRDEAGQAKGTASLLARCLSRVELRIGERFDPLASTAGLVLLYPATPGNAATAESAPARHGEALHGNPLAGTPPLTTLVVLDGTWRRTRRLLHENPWLQALPRMALDAPPPSRYAIRRAHTQSQRSTLEACALALAQLDGDQSRYAPLWAAMDAFIALQQGLAERTPPVGGAGAR